MNIYLVKQVDKPLYFRRASYSPCTCFSTFQSKQIFFALFRHTLTTQYFKVLSKTSCNNCRMTVIVRVLSMALMFRAKCAHRKRDSAPTPHAQPDPWSLVRATMKDSFLREVVIDQRVLSQVRCATSVCMHTSSFTCPLSFV